MAEIYAQFFSEYALKGTRITRTRWQIDVENCFPESVLYRTLEGGGSRTTYFFTPPDQKRPVQQRGFSGKFDRPLFSERENSIAHIMLGEVPWFHDKAWPNHSRETIAGLTPRLYTTINLLLQGMPRKKVAADMGISIHTLNGFIKDIYSHFGAHSQSEMIRCFVVGDGGDMKSGPLIFLGNISGKKLFRSVAIPLAFITTAES